MKEKLKRLRAWINKFFTISRKDFGLPGDNLALITRQPEERQIKRPPSEYLEGYARARFEELIKAASSEYAVGKITVDHWDNHTWQWEWPGKAGREWDGVTLKVAHEGPLRIVAGVTEADPIFVYHCFHRTTPVNVNIQSLLYADASGPMHIWVSSVSPFSVENVSAHLRLNPEVIRKFREKQLEEEGCCGSIPHPDSAAGRKFYLENPSMIP